jgi:hypothetical protein
MRHLPITHLPRKTFSQKDICPEDICPERQLPIIILPIKSMSSGNGMFTLAEIGNSRKYRFAYYIANKKNLS